jgi:hypothetical protein
VCGSQTGVGVRVYLFLGGWGGSKQVGGSGGQIYLILGFKNEVGIVLLGVGRGEGGWDGRVVLGFCWSEQFGVRRRH